MSARSPVDNDFRLLGLPPLARSTVDRDEPLRDDVERQLRMWPDAVVLGVDRRGNAAVRGGRELVLRPATEFGDTPPADAVLLGEQNGRAYWAVHAESPAETGQANPWGIWNRAADAPQVQWLNLRGIGAELSGNEAGLMATAVSVLYWHAHAQFCTVCGARTVPVRAGWARDCTGCGRQEYPRTDPAVIVLVHDGVDHVLLARQPAWPAGHYSVLAGFVEAGESLEATVVREVHEEVGVLVRDVRYLGSQPWPFPRSLMIGFTAIADRHAAIIPADGEIEAACWVHRDEVLAAIEAGGVTERIGLPRGSSIAGAMVDSWARSGD